MSKLLSIVIIALLMMPAFAQDDIDCDAPLELWQIQGEYDQPNCLRERILTENNIITAIGYKGFFIQTPAERSDNNERTSDGMYVNVNYPTNRMAIQVGDMVHVTGRIEEIYNMTQLSAQQTKVEIVSSGNPMPEPIDLLTIDTSYQPGETHPLERYEGMYVALYAVTTTAPTNKFDEFGVSLTGERTYREMGIESDTTPEFVGLGLPEWDLNPEVIEVDPPEMGLPVEQLNSGSVVTVTGGIAYSYLDYQLWPNYVEVHETSAFTARPVRVREDGEFTVATLNVENLFDILDDPDRDDSVYEDYVPDNQADYDIRLGKASAYIRDVLNAPDILAIQEIENENTVNDLIARIQEDDPTLIYAGCLFEGHDTRGIDNAYIIRTNTVNMLDCYQLPGSYEAHTAYGDELFGRPPLVLDAEIIIGEQSFPITTINLHIKSLSGIDTPQVQSKRLEQAITIANYIQQRMDENPDINLVVLGDMNAFQFSDGLVDVVGIISGTHDPAHAIIAPENDLVEPNMTNQTLLVPENDRYSYIYNSHAQVLDHILTSSTLSAYVTDRQFGRGNADSITTLALEAGPLRLSDHDGFVVYIKPD